MKKITEAWLIAAHEDLSISEQELDFLNRVYRFRYPPDRGLLPHGQPEKHDGQKAFDIAKKVFKKVKDILCYNLK